MAEKSEFGAVEHRLSNAENEKHTNTRVTETNAASVALGKNNFFASPAFQLVAMYAKISPPNNMQLPPSRRKGLLSAQRT